MAPVQRLAIEGMLSQGTSRRVLSKIVACSHVSIGRHYRKHMRYPPDWSKEIKMSVLKFASVRGPAIVDVFRERNWIGWAEYGNLLKRARNAGYDPGYQLTLAVMAWLSTKQEESRKLEVLVKYMPRPKPYLDLLNWLRMETTTRGQRRLRYRFKIGYDGRSFIRRYKP